MHQTEVARGRCLDEFGDILQVKDFAALTGLSLNSAYEAVRRGEVPHIKIGSRILIPKRVLETLIDNSICTKA